MNSVFRSGSSVTISCSIAVAFILAGMLPAAHGQSVTWLNTGTNFNTGSLWSGGAVPTAANIAVFGNTATNQPTLTASSTVSGLQFGTANWTISGQPLSIGSGGITLASSSTNKRTFSNAITLGANQTWMVANPVGNANVDLEFRNAVTPASGSANLTLDGGGKVDLQQSGRLYVGTSGTLTVQGAVWLFGLASSTPMFDAGTVMLRGGHLTLGSSSLNNFGSDSVAPTITVRGGQVTIGGGGAAAANRLRDTASVVLEGGMFIGSRGNANYDEVFASVSVGAGGSLWGTQVSDNGGFAPNATLISTGSSISRGAARGTLLFQGSNFEIANTSSGGPGGRGRIIITNTSGLTLIGGGGLTSSTTTTNNSIVPWAVGASTGGATTDGITTSLGTGFVTYDSTLGVRLLTSTNYDSALGTAGNNVRYAINGTPTGNQTANALLLDTNGSAGAARTLTGDGSLTITSGALMLGGDTSSASNVTNTGTIGGFTGLVFGSSESPREAFVTVAAIHANTASSNFRTAGTLTISSPITTADGLTKSGPGTLVLSSAANSFSGPTTINGGTLRLGASNALPTGSAVAINGGVGIASGTITPVGTNRNLVANTFLDLNGFNQTVAGLTGGELAAGLPGGVVTNSATGTSTLTHTGSSTFAGQLQDGGAGRVLALVKSTGGMLTLTGSNNYSGGTQINAGVLNYGNTAALGTGMVNFTNNGTLQAGVTGTVANSVSIGSGVTGSFDTQANNTTLSGVIAGSGNLAKIGAGTLTLSAASTYTGTKSINAGTLALGSAGTFANSPMIRVGNAGSSGVVLDLTSKTSGFTFGSGQTVSGIGTINIGAGQTVTSAGIWAPGNSIGSNAVTGNLTLSGTSQFELGLAGTSLTSPGNADFTAVSGTLTLGGNLALIDNANDNSLGSYGAGSYRLFTAPTVSGTFASVTAPVGATTTRVAMTYSSGTASGQGVFANVYNLAVGSVTSGTSLNFGLIHAGGSFTSQAVSIGNTATAGSFSEGLNASVSGSTGNATSGGTAVTNLSAGGSASTITVNLGDTATGGVKNGTVTIDYQSNGATTSGLAAISAGSEVVNLTGSVFSGTGTWNQAGGGSWGSQASNSWTIAGGVAAAPGTFIGYANTDRAIFGSAVSSGTAAIALNGAQVGLASLTLNNSAARYLIESGTGSGSLALAAASGKPVVDVVGTHEIAAAINGTNGLEKTGLGKLILSGSSNYSGGTDISAGTLAVNGFLGGAVNVANAAILGGSGSINGLVTVAAGGILAPGNSPGTLTMNSGLVLDAASILNFELSSTNFTEGGGINDLINVTGNFTLDGILNVTGLGDFSTVADNTKWRLFNFTGGTFTNGGLTLGTMPSVGSTGKYFQIDTATAGQVNLVIVPEPGAIALAGIGAAAAAWALRRRK